MFRKFGRIATLTATAMLMAAPAAAQKKEKPAAAAPASVSTELSLSGNWQFALATGAKDAERFAGFQDKAYDASAFRPIPVPSNWVMQGYDKPQYKHFKGDAAEGFYLHRFRLPAGWKDQRLLLHFDGVWSSAEVWLNGTYLGRHDSGFTRASFDISSARTDGENLLAVRVRQLTPDSALDTNDDWTIGGIYRDVTIEAMPKNRWLDRVQVETDFDNEYRDADLRVRLMVGDTFPRTAPGNYMYPGGEAYAVRLSLLDAAGKLVKAQEIPVESHPGTGRETFATMRIERPLHWTAETPNLYRLNVELLENGKVAHSRTMRVGFREITTVGGVLRVNGQPIKLRGVNRHEEHPDTGRATTPAQWLEDIKLMKAANINYIRLAHYPSAKGFIDLADELGMYLSNEISYGYGGDRMHNPATASGALLRNYETVERDINHPSVIIWSVGNEDPLTSLHVASAKMVKALDPTRPLLLPWRSETWLPPEIDILSAHYWTATKYDELGARADRPIIATEWTHAFGIDGFGGLAERWKALTRHPTGAGGAIWLWADQGLTLKRRKPDGSEESYLELNDDGFDGIVDAYRKPTRDYWETKAVYAPVFPDVERLEFTPGQPVLRVPIRNDFDFTDLKAVKIGWKLIEGEREIAAGSTSVAAPPRTVAALEVPLASLRSVKPGTFYALRLSFGHDGLDIGDRTVELVSAMPQVAPPPAATAPVVSEDGGKTVVAVGDARYVFDPATGTLASAARAGVPLITGSRPTIWRPMNHSEMIIVRSEKGLENLPDLDRYTAQVTNWKVEQAAGKAVVRASVRYTVDASNRFDADYEYIVHPTGELVTRYTIRPAVQAKWLPYVGIEFETAAGLDKLKYLGLGPYDAYPNEKSAANLGIWNETLAGQGGMKSVRWAEIAGTGAGFRLTGDAYLGYAAGEPGKLRLLSSLLGRPTKLWRPEDPGYRLDTGPDASFAGEYRISLP